MVLASWLRVSSLGFRVEGSGSSWYEGPIPEKTKIPTDYNRSLQIFVKRASLCLLGEGMDHCPLIRNLPHPSMAP